MHSPSFGVYPEEGPLTGNVAHYDDADHDRAQRNCPDGRHGVFRPRNQDEHYRVDLGSDAPVPAASHTSAGIRRQAKGTAEQT